jgi:phosphatidate cytidylyltransferase
VGDLKKRAASTFVIGPLIVLLFLFLPPKLLFLFVALIVVGAVYELSSIMAAGNPYAVTVLAVISLAPLYTGLPTAFCLWLLLSSALLLLLKMTKRRGEMESVNRDMGKSMAAMLLGEVFLAFPLFSLYSLKHIDPYLPLALLLIIWASDTAAYLLGRATGRHKLAPLISPKKTVEGLAGALAGAILVTVLFRGRMGLDVVSGACVGAGLGLLGQLGDILESTAKRVCAVKDSSSLIPGHGGILDRVDSFILTAPFLYHYLSGLK